MIDKQINKLQQQLDQLKVELEQEKALKETYFTCYKAKHEDIKGEFFKLKTENEDLIRRITKIFACLIKANKTNKIVDTLWVDNITTLWDYIALTLGIEGDQVQIERQILQKKQ